MEVLFHRFSADGRLVSDPKGYYHFGQMPRIGELVLISDEDEPKAHCYRIYAVMHQVRVSYAVEAYGIQVDAREAIKPPSQ